jgi:PDZ domain-containing secreted protein
VDQVGVQYFLVPVNQGEDGLDGIRHAREVVGDDVEIIPVATLDDALAALERLGGDPLVPVDAATAAAAG